MIMRDDIVNWENDLKSLQCFAEIRVFGRKR